MDLQANLHLSKQTGPTGPAGGAAAAPPRGGNRITPAAHLLAPSRPVCGSRTHQKLITTSILRLVLLRRRSCQDDLEREGGAAAQAAWAAAPPGPSPPTGFTFLNVQAHRLLLLNT